MTRSEIVTNAHASAKADGISFGEMQRKVWLAKRLVERMENGNTSFSYYKVEDGSLRLATGRFPSLKVSKDGRLLIGYFDREKFEWRSCRASTLNEVMPETLPF